MSSIAMMPRDQISTLWLYSFCLTTSGAIQYGVPTIVARLFLSIVSLAQNPKSAVALLVFGLDQCTTTRLTDFHATVRIEKDVIALDVAMDNVLSVEMGKALAGL